jgi:hypothetical protein
MTRRPKVDLLSIDEFCERNAIDRPRYWEMIGEDLLPPPVRSERHKTLRVRVVYLDGEP